MLFSKSEAEQLVEALVNLFESQGEADGDFCGEQREWHLPRLNKAARGLMFLFPVYAAEAIGKAKSPYDEAKSALPK